MDYIAYLLIAMPLFFVALSLWKAIFTTAEFQIDPKHINDGELQIGFVSNIRLWNKDKPGKTIFDSFVGEIILTNRRVLFISSGKSGIARLISDNVISGIIYEIFMNSKDKKEEKNSLSLNRLSNKGSISLCLEDIRNVEIERKKIIVPLSNYDYLTIKYEVGGETHSLCVKSEFFRSRFSAVKTLAQQLTKNLPIQN